MNLTEAIANTIAEHEAATQAELDSLRRSNAELIGTVKEQRALIGHLLNINERVSSQRDTASAFNNMVVRAKRDAEAHEGNIDDGAVALERARQIVGRGNGTVSVRGEPLPQTEPLPQGIMPRAE